MNVITQGRLQRKSAIGSSLQNFVCHFRVGWVTRSVEAPFGSVVATLRGFAHLGALQPYATNTAMVVALRATTRRARVQPAFDGCRSVAQSCLSVARAKKVNGTEYQAENLGRQSDPLDVFLVQHLIDNDAATGKNYQELASQVFDIFQAKPMMTDEFTKAIIKPIRKPFKWLFGFKRGVGPR